MVQKIKRAYTKGTRIRLIRMGEDSRPVEPGTEGTVEHVDDIGTIHCRFDTGRQLGLIWGVDSFELL